MSCRGAVLCRITIRLHVAPYVMLCLVEPGAGTHDELHVMFTTNFYLHITNFDVGLPSNSIPSPCLQKRTRRKKINQYNYILKWQRGDGWSIDGVLAGRRFKIHLAKNSTA